MAKVPYYPTKVEVWMVLTPEGGEALEIPVQEISMRFMLNTMPTAHVTVATGVDAANPGRKSNIHALTMNLRRGCAAKVFCKLTGTAGPLNGKLARWPAKEFMIFDGKVANVSPEIGNGMRLSMGLVHWLVDLDETLWLSSILDPGSPEALVRPAGVPSPSQKESVWATGGWFSKPSEIMADLWVGGAKPLLIKVANNMLGSHIGRDRGFILNVNGSKDPVNAQATKALERMDNAKEIVVPKLPLALGPRVGYRFLLHMAMDFWSMGGPPTLWSRLLMFGGNLLSPMVPNVETATFIPYTPVLPKGSEWITLDPSEVWSITGNPQLHRNIRGVVLLPQRPANYGNPKAGAAGAARSEAGMRAGMQVAGIYMADGDNAIPDDVGGKANGMVIVRKVHPWLDYIHPDMIYTAIERSTLQTSKVDPAAAQKALGADEAKALEAGDKLAKSVFMNEVFKHRPVAVATRLRFDIAPGSFICVKGSDPNFDIPGFTADGLYGSVTVVNVTISAAAKNCMTTLELSHTRLASEVGFAMKEHPFFGKGWRGSPLINLPGVTPPLIE